MNTDLVLLEYFNVGHEKADITRNPEFLKGPKVWNCPNTTNRQEASTPKPPIHKRLRGNEYHNSVPAQTERIDILCA